MRVSGNGVGGRCGVGNSVVSGFCGDDEMGRWRDKLLLGCLLLLGLVQWGSLFRDVWIEWGNIFHL